MKQKLLKLVATIVIAMMGVMLFPKLIGNDTVLADGDVITTVEISGVELPKAGDSGSTYGLSNMTTNGSTAGYTVEIMGWYNHSTKVDTFEAGKTYGLWLILHPVDPHHFPAKESNCTYTLNGTEYRVSSDFTEGTIACASGQIEFYYKVPGPKYDITFDNNGGSGNMDKMQIEENNELTLPECAFAPPTNKEFVKWQIGTEYYMPGDKVTITQATTVAAIWDDIETYTITYHMNGHGTSIDPKTGIPRYSKLLDYLPKVSNDGDWIFGGWYEDPDFQSRVISGTKISSDMELYAYWYKEIKTVTIDGVELPKAGDSGSTYGLSNITTNGSTAGYTVEIMGWYDYSTKVDTFEAGKTYGLWLILHPVDPHHFPAKESNCTYTLNGTEYRVSSDFTEGTIACASGQIEFFYKVPKDVSITFNSNGGSSVTTQTIEEGNKVTKPSDPTKSGFTFGGWYKDSECTKAYDFDSEVTADITLYAKWTATPTTPPEESEKSFEDFVERLYTVALGRASEPEGKAFWCEHVGNGDLNGAQCANEFLLSKEFNDRKLTDEQFLEVLYKTFFNREAKDDKDGFNFWMNCLKTQGRDSVVDCFINSEEWCNVCASYGVRSGATRAKATIASANATAFATRLYTECLGRDPEEGGLKFWSLGLTNQELSGTQAAKEFFYSPEFVNAKYSDEEYIYRMYKTFMGREPEAEGKAYWLSELKNGTTRDEVFNFFSTCPEFTGICKEYAIVR